MAADTEKTIGELIEHYRSERSKLDKLRAPAFQMTEGSDADQDFRIQSGVRYALDFVDVLLQRIQALEQRVADLESN